VEYSKQPPRFCSNCGVALSEGAGDASNQGAYAPCSPEQGVDTPRSPQATPPTALLATVPYAAPRPGSGDHPESIGGYRLLDILGGGGMGTVFKAEEKATGRQVAVKLIRPDFADSTDAVERFRREGRLASTILHPRCVFIQAADEEAGRPYIVMELMPGTTLHDLVEKRGPLPVREAVSYVLDVIEGLQEAHHGGVVHRDVKPSNCFVDSESRVKVGDFGLAKSLIGPEHLTQSGAFLGTLLFASPEQIRNEPVNYLSDVYSACATLYYLLTGRAPFQGDDNDAAATLARTVTEPLTPMRKHRPEVPGTLDDIVLRGLARSRRQRWQSLEELRLALVPFVAETHSVGEIGWRVSAYLCDLLLLIVAEILFHRGVRGWWTEVVPGPGSAILAALVTGFICGLIYFAIPETLWGCTPGKFLMRLRVRDATTNDLPSIWRSLLRTSCFFAFKELLALSVSLLLLVGGVRLWTGGAITVKMMLAMAGIGALPFLSGTAGALLLAVTMRRRNGYRGLHELVSRTKVIRLPSLRPRFVVPARVALPERETLPAEVPVRVGTFAVRGVARFDVDELVLYGEDEALGRPVWLWLRQGEKPLPAGRRETARATRPRWLAGGTQDGWTWDAFVASPGCSLTNLVERSRLGWMDTLSVLHQLTSELLAASADGTLPLRLTAEQVWVQPSGQVLLLDTGPRAGDSIDTPLDLLRQTAAVALEGRPRSPADLCLPIRAPVPGHARELLERLMGGPDGFTTLTDVEPALAEEHAWPEEINRPDRALQVAFTAVAMAPGLILMFALGPALMLIAFMLCVIGKAFVEAGLEKTETRLTSARVELVARPEVTGKLTAVARLQGEERRREQLHESQLGLARQRDIVVRSVSWFIQRSLPPLEEKFGAGYLESVRNYDEEELDSEDLDFLATLGAADDLTVGPSPAAEEMLDAHWEIALGLLAWPLLWSLWAGLTRGGLGMRLAGMALRNRDGRPASRWRCALRSLAIWVPIALLLLASVLLDLWRVAHAPSGWSDFAIRATAWLAWATWWGALLALAGYVGVAMGWPNGGPHDRMAGTYPVPR
jgi:hypothetical protein